MKLFRCSNPIGTVRLGKGEPLVQGQTYSMSLMLEVPDTQANEDHGMFMSCLSIASSSGVMIERSCKSSMLAYRLVSALKWIAMITIFKIKVGPSPCDGDSFLRP